MTSARFSWIRLANQCYKPVDRWFEIQLNLRAGEIDESDSLVWDRFRQLAALFMGMEQFGRAKHDSPQRLCRLSWLGAKIRRAWNSQPIPDLRPSDPW